ncbi:Crp/Fnr family transcriptional regulator [Sphingomonas sp.]|jgi:CRP-like cAMP-binding protein|uniref:Crp/Fnr family transcriptional regulator n=1 Tax=Sphingomonas sp. TaxID=28214 RepID=UPI002DEBDFD9|nr:Crp/Fnr family transcriptional regulator [Sphingomonas sp.]
MVDKLSYWGSLDNDDTQALLRLPHKVKLMERHAFVVREREMATHSCLVIEGFAIRHKIVSNGARQIVAVHMKGDLVDLQNSFLGVADHSVQMITPGKVAFIPRENVKELAFSRPNVGMAMWFDTLVDGSIFREWIANVGRRDAHTRLAHLLCEFSLRLKVAGLGEATEYELPMTQEQLADCTGLTPVHVNRTLKVLEAEQLITRRSSRTVTIGDWKKLAEAGDFDSTYLHLRQSEPALA